MVLSNSLKHRLSIIRELSMNEWFLLFQAWWILLWESSSLRLSNLERVQQSILAITPSNIVPSDPLAYARRLHKIVYLASRLHLPSAACLQRSLTLQRMLARKGISAQLCIGVNSRGNAVFAHAWLQVKDKPVGEPEDIQENFKILEPLT